MGKSSSVWKNFLPRMAVRAMQQAAAIASVTEINVAVSDEAMEFRNAWPTVGMPSIFAMSACPKFISSFASGRITDRKKKHRMINLMNPRIRFSRFDKE